MSAHTPGPWIVLRRDDEEEGTLVKHVGEYDEFLVCETNVSWREPRRNAANARLIAAAPELLTALKYARRFMKPEDHDTKYLDEVIAKAEGGAA